MLKRWVKAALLTCGLVAAGHYFGTLCSRVQFAYSLLLPPSRPLLVLLLQLLLSIGIVAVAAGVVACLFRPIWIAFIAFALSAAAMLWGWGYSIPRAALAVQQELRQRVEFSVRVVAEGQALLLVALLAIALSGFYLGYSAQIQREGFSIPERYRNRIADDVSSRIASAVPELFRDAIRTAAHQQLQSLLSDQFGRTVKPFERYIPVAAAALLLLPLLAAAYLLTWVPIVVLWVVFIALRLRRVVKVTTETIQVRRLVIG
jgi:Flp pilus assembly protein TadB